MESDQVRLEFASRYILEQIGVEVEETDESVLERMAREFEGAFPATRTFSAFARSMVTGVTAQDDPDSVAVASSAPAFRSG